MPPKAKKTEEVQILEVEMGQLEFYILGTTPLILNRMSEKAKRQLLLPSGRKTSADKQSTLKHQMFEEFQASPYLDPNPDGATYLMHLASAFKGAMRGAAIDLPKLTKTQIGRLVRVEGERIGVYGLPKMMASVVRSADINKTPDIRTRAIIPEWACKINVSFVRPLLREKSVINLLSFAGLTQGTGDWRSEKGSADYGSFQIVGKDDPQWNFLADNYGRDVQMDAMSDPEPYDRETEELYDWWKNEVKERGHKNVRTSGNMFTDETQTNPSARNA